MKFRNSIVITFIGLLLFSCIEKARVTIPKSEKKLVVTCFISPKDSVITAVVKLSTPRIGMNGTLTSAATVADVQNALVKISDGLNERVIPFDNKLLYYKIPSSLFPIIEGKKYYLEVSTPDGKSINAGTEVPIGKLEVESLSTAKTKDDEKAIDLDVNMSINDIPNRTNYLAIFYSQLIEPSSNQDVFTVFGFFDTDEKIHKTKFTHYTNVPLLSDSIIRLAQLNLYILNCSKEFYLYNKSVQESGVGSFNPFSEPVLIYSDINGGFGCFGAYTQTMINIKVR